MPAIINIIARIEYLEVQFLCDTRKVLKSTLDFTE